MSDQAAAPAPDDTSAAPAAAPVAPAPAALTPEPKPNLGAPVPQDVVVEYSATGDAALDLALNFIGQRGFGPERPEMVAAAQGDFGPIEAALKAQGDKARGYERYLAAAKGSFEARKSVNAAKANAVQAIAVEAAGSVERWNAIHAWASKVADPQEKAEIDAGLKAGGAAARGVVQYLSTLYAQSGEDKAPAAAVIKASAAGSVPESGAISATEFKAELSKLRRQYGDKLEGRPENEKLQARRLSAINNGQ